MRLSPVLCGLVLVAVAVAADAAALRRDIPDSNLNLDLKPLCTMGAEGGFSDQVAVFIHADNSRYLELGDVMSGTQTAVPCSGDMPKSCLSSFKDGDGPPPACVMVDCPCARNTSHLVSFYGQKMMENVIPMCQGSGDSFRVLNIGLGGGQLPSYMLAQCRANTDVDSVEFDPRIIVAAEKFFGADDPQGRHQMSSGDGGAAIAERYHAGKQYDVVVVDAFDAEGNVPGTCSDDDFLKNAQLVLRPGGKLVMQVWNRQYPELMARFQKHFGASNVVANDAKFGQWILVAVSAQDPKNPWGVGLLQRSARGARRGA